MKKQLTETAAVKATGTLTTSNVLANLETLTIGTIVYTFKTTLAGAFDVLVGASLSASLDNLKAAINRAAGEGSTYGYGTVAHPQVTATTKTGTTLLIEAKAEGTAANAITTTSTAATGAWGAVTLAGGIDYSQALTKTSAATGTSVDISALNPAPAVGSSADYLIRLTVLAFTAAVEATAHALARFSFPDSVNAFSASIPGPSFAFESPIVAAAPVTVSVNSKDYPGLRLGVGSAVTRCNLDALTASASITYSAEIEQPQ